MSLLVVADTSALVSLTSVTDSNHQLATKISQEIADTDVSLILPADVFTETINVLGKKINRAVAIQAGQMLLSSNSFPILEANPDIRATALEKYQHQGSNTSFTDCVVMAFVDAYGATAIFGFDEHFTKSGYSLL